MEKMPWSPEERAIYMKAYRQKNKGKLKQQELEWRELNKEKIKLCYEKNRQTEVYKKSHRIKNWKRLGIILRNDQTWDSIYTKYLDCENCEQCNKVFKNSMDRQLDHCHTTGFIRNIVCRSCNTLRGIEDKN